jgi:hypothetical protein
MVRGSFPQKLRHFLRSVDFVDKKLEDDIYNGLRQYLAKDENVRYAELMKRRRSNDDMLVLESEWRVLDGARLDRGDYAAQPRDELRNGTPATSNAIQSVWTRQPLWIIAPEEEPLATAPVLIDAWTSEPVPGKYKPPTNAAGQPVAGLRTSIVHPLTFNGAVVGALDLESSEHLEPVETALAEVGMLADALGTLIGMRSADEHAARLRDNALGEISSDETLLVGLALTKPTLFFAWPHAAMNESHGERVVTIARDVLSEFGDRLCVFDWSEDHELGDINSKLYKQLQGAHYGLCYFSERDTATATFIDNSNVLFEAGMLHAVGSKWIPMREDTRLCAQPPPFDLASQKYLIVPRRADSDALDEAAYRMKLSEMLTTMLAPRN